MNEKSPESGATSPRQRRMLLEQLLRERASQPDASYPLSQSQLSMWFLHRLDPESAAYNTGFAARIRSTVNIPALRRSLQSLLDRHSALRMRFIEVSGKPVQRLQAHRELPFEHVDASAWTSDELDRRVHAAYRRSFDLENGPLLRAHLFSRSAAEHVLLLTIHHIACDGWSFWILIDELFVLYKAESSGISASLPQLTVQHTDFVDWQLRMLAGPEGERMWKYWQTKLTGRLPILNLPTDRPRPPRQTFNGASRCFKIPEKAAQALKSMASNEGATLYMALLAAYDLLLHRYAGQDDILIGSPTTGRSRAEFAGVVGDFINMVVLRQDLSGNPPFKDFLGKVRRTVLESLEHQDYPFPRLVERLGVPRDPSTMPVFQSIFIFQKAQRFSEFLEVFDSGETDAHVEIGGLTLESFPLGQEEGQFDLSLEMMEVRGSLLGKLKYNTDLFEAETIERMAGHFQTLLEGIVVDPSRRLSELPLLTAAEREQMLVEWNKTGREYRSNQGPAQLFEAQVKRTPEAVAVVYGDRHLTYAELNRRANRSAHYLKRLGVGPDVLVGICLERSLDMMVGLLGILKAGGAYLPLDPEFPRERLRFMLEDSGAALLVTQEALLEGLPDHGARVICLDRDGEAIEGESEENPDSGTKPEDLAYVIYTSGSTGKPKGVEIPLGAVANFLQAMRREPGIGAEDALLAVTTLSFDIAGLELYLPLTVGARVVIASRETASDGMELAKLLTASGARVMQATPASWKLLRAGGWKGDGRLKMLCGGEALPMELAKELVGTGGELWNMYGPTETTIWSTVARVRGGEERISIGKPIDNTRVYILDGHRQPVPIGVPGELHIGGEGLARGYLNRSELMAEKFIGDPFSDAPGARLYRTGDSARWQADGSIECLGRLDDQVKVRGFRIELGEIEAVLREQSGVKDAVVSARGDQGGEKRLVGYVTANDQANVNVDQLRQLLKSKLPDYMIPASFVRLEAFPLTPNGKVDRRALPAPEGMVLERNERFSAPRTPIEEVLAGLWEEVLGRERIGIHDDFFELGGHSLLATQLIYKLQDAFQVDLSLRQLFESPTVAGLAEVILKNEKDRGKVEGRARILVKLAELSKDEIIEILEEKTRLFKKDRIP